MPTKPRRFILLLIVLQDGHWPYKEVILLLIGFARWPLTLKNSILLLMSLVSWLQCLQENLFWDWWVLWDGHWNYKKFHPPIDGVCEMTTVPPRRFSPPTDGFCEMDIDPTRRFFLLLMGFAWWPLILYEVSSSHRGVKCDGHWPYKKIHAAIAESCEMAI